MVAKKSSGIKLFLNPILLVAILAVLIAGAMMVIDWLSAPPKVAESPKEPATSTTGPEVEISEQPTRGSLDAPVTIIEFAEFYCPYCARHAFETFPKIEEEYIKKDLVKYEFRNFVVHGEPAMLAAQAGECAQAQGKFWEFHDRLFVVIFKEKEEYLSEEDLVEVARELSLDEEAFNLCLSSGQMKKEIEKDQDKLDELIAQLPEGERPQRLGTPTFFINGRPLIGAWPFEKFKEIIEEELKKQSK